MPLPTTIPEWQSLSHLIDRATWVVGASAVVATFLLALWTKSYPDKLAADWRLKLFPKEKPGSPWRRHPWEPRPPNYWLHFLLAGWTPDLTTNLFLTLARTLILVLGLMTAIQGCLVFAEPECVRMHLCD